MPVSVIRRNPDESQALDLSVILDDLGLAPVTVRRTASVACGVAAIALGFLAIQQFRKG